MGTCVPLCVVAPLHAFCCKGLAALIGSDDITLLVLCLAAGLDQQYEVVLRPDALKESTAPRRRPGAAAAARARAAAHAEEELHYEQPQEPECYGEALPQRAGRRGRAASPIAVADEEDEVFWEDEPGCG